MTLERCDVNLEAVLCAGTLALGLGVFTLSHRGVWDGDAINLVGGSGLGTRTEVQSKLFCCWLLIIASVWAPLGDGVVALVTLSGGV